MAFVKRTGFAREFDTTDFNSSDFSIEVSKGNIPGVTLIHKFGHNETVGTSFVPIVSGGVWNTPQVANATAFRVKAGNAGDTNGGAGAWEIEIHGILPTGASATATLTLAGTSASAATAQTFIRILRAFVTKSGAYASQTTASHIADIVIENAAGGTDWATIPTILISQGQTQIGVYTVPLGFSAYLQGFTLAVETNKPLDVVFLKRGSILDTAAPYQAMRVFSEVKGLEGTFTEDFKYPMKFDELTDIGAMAKVSTGSAKVSIDMELILVEN